MEVADMGGYYPDGVTGNEVEIAGVDEIDVREWCDECEKITAQVLFWHPAIIPEQECSECGQKIEVEKP